MDPEDRINEENQSVNYLYKWMVENPLNIKYNIPKAEPNLKSNYLFDL